MNKNIKNALIGFAALAIIIIGVKMAMTSSDSETLDIDTATASSTVFSAASSTDTAGSRINDGRTRDANGCISSADFVWDAKIGSCVHKSKVSAPGPVIVPQPSNGSVPASIAANLCSSVGGQWSEKVRECQGVTKNACESVGGQFAECASACRNDPNAQVCTMQCVQVCSIK